VTVEHPQDRALVEGLRGGEAQAVETLVARYAGRIRRLVTSLLPDARDAERVTRDVLSRVVREIDAYADSQVFLSWVYRIALETAREQMPASRGSALTRRARSRRAPSERQRPRARGAD
jgi:DNA-directed RNA polymerase specialized sigma24 family protein